MAGLAWACMRIESECRSDACLETNQIGMTSVAQGQGVLETNEIGMAGRACLGNLQVITWKQVGSVTHAVATPF